MAKPAHPSFEAVREFEEIRKRTNKRGDIGDSVSILATEEKNGQKSYKILAGIVVRYRSDAGRIVLDYNGKEHSVSSSDVRAYIRLIEKKEDTAHENYLTIEHFGMLKDNEEFNIKKIGQSVVVLTTENDRPWIKNGLISYIGHSNSGSYYSITHRDGTVTEYVRHDHIVSV